jgi:hypothetical protein
LWVAVRPPSMPRVYFKLSTRAHPATVRLMVRDIKKLSEWDPGALGGEHNAYDQVFLTWLIRMNYTLVRDSPDELRINGHGHGAHMEEVYHYTTLGKVTTVTHDICFALLGWRWLFTPVVYLQMRRQANAASEALAQRLVAVENYGF